MLKSLLILLLLSPTIVIAKTDVIKGKGKHAGKTFHTGLLQKPLALQGFGELHSTFADCGSLPASFDLRDIGVVPPTRDQGQCGSCWAFSKTGSLESALLGAGKKLDLSEQELVSCDMDSAGCQGGYLDGFKFQIQAGQVLESSFPYTATTGTCRGGLTPAARGVSYAMIGQAGRGPTESELKCALYKTHTIPWITVNATDAWGMGPASYKTPYSGCIYSTTTNHAVGVVGWWTDDQGQTQFIMRNSWGSSWGDGGFMSLPLGCDNYGAEAAFIITDAKPDPCKPASVKLPVEVDVAAHTEIVLGVRPEKDVTYQWTMDGVKFGNAAQIYITPTKDHVMKLVGKNACSTSESSVRIKIAAQIK